MKKALLLSLCLLNFVACSRNKYKDVKVDGYYFQTSNLKSDFQGSRSLVDIHNGKMTMYEFSSDLKKYKVITGDVSVEGRKAKFTNLKSDCGNDFVQNEETLVIKNDGVLKIKADTLLSLVEIDGKDAQNIIETLQAGEMDCSVDDSNLGIGSPEAQRKDFALAKTMNQMVKNKVGQSTEKVSDEIFTDSENKPKHDSGQ